MQRRVGDARAVGRPGHVKREGGLEVWRVQAGKHVPRVAGLQLRRCHEADE